MQFNKYARGRFENFFMFLAIGIGLTVLIVAAPSWGTSGTLSQFNEDTFFTYNLTANVSNPQNETLSFQILNITSDPDYGTTAPGDYYWITLDSSTGILSINTTRNNESGRYNMTIFVKNPSEAGQSDFFYFIANATNDAPVFSNIQNEYNLTQDSNFLDYLNATDEEEQYPLVFNITFFGNCTHADWSGRNPGENCTILDAVNFTNTSAIMNFTPGLNDVGTYWANITVMDFGNSSDYGCPHSYCTPETYNQNQTTLYSSIVKFNVGSILSVNVSDCQNKIFEENVSGSCQINITTPGTSDALNITSLATMRNYNGGIANNTWFFTNTSTNAENFSKSININFTPQKTEIGNWSISFSVYDVNSEETDVEEIYVYVNKNASLDDAPKLDTINNLETSVNLLTTININVSDNDLKIPHKNSDYGGYNETLDFNVTIFNASDLSQQLNLTGFDVDVLSMPVLSGGVPTNVTTARIQFTPNQSEGGNYTVNLTVTDLNGVTDNQEFNLFVLTNNFPHWNESLVTIYSLVEGGNFYYNLSANVTDLDNDTLTFSNWTSTYFPGFYLNTSSGEINISSVDDDSVGQHIVNITVSDGYLTNTTQFNFTINNTNEIPFIKTPLTAVNGITVNISNSNMNTTEDVAVEFNLYINDTDFNIRQKDFYNETLSINLTIEGVNTSLFNLSFETFQVLSGVNYSRYAAIFTPRKSDVGTYNISINVSDSQNASDFISFNLTIEAIQHNPNMTAKDDLDSSIEESIIVDFNATDLEEGTDANGTMRFNVTFLSGDDFIDGNESIFNSTSGVLSFDFNSNASYSGVYSLNVSVNDTTGRQDSIVWNLTVYDYPQILSPNASYIYSMFENVTSNLAFSVNHTVQDELNYYLYIDGVLRNSTSSGNGNASNYIWPFTTNFTDETTASGNVNLTLNVSNSKLSNSSTWSLAINHSNAPLNFLGSLVLGTANNIGGLDNVESGAGTITFDLSDFFSDIDAVDSYWNQTIGFTVNYINGSEAITFSVSNWTNQSTPSVSFTNPSTASLTANYSLIAYEYNTTNVSHAIKSLSANNFTLEISPATTPVVVTTPSSGGGGGSRTTTKPISLKIIVPEPVSSRRKDKLVLPISLANTGKTTLNDIFLQAGVSKDGLAREDLIASFDTSVINKLDIGETKDLTLIVDANTEEYGLYEITLNATVRDPDYNDWAKIFINVEETEDILERIIFTEEFVIGNPECVELTELVDEARGFLNAGAIDESYKKLDEALEACRLAIEQPPYVRVRNQFEKYLFNYVWIISLVIFMAGFLYYSYRRRKLKKGLREVREVSKSLPKEKFNNKKKLV